MEEYSVLLDYGALGVFAVFLISLTWWLLRANKKLSERYAVKLEERDKASMDMIKEVTEALKDKAASDTVLASAIEKLGEKFQSLKEEIIRGRSHE